MNFSHKNKIIPFSFLHYYIPIFLITSAGFINMIYLLTAHHRVYTDIGYESFCAISRSINCDTVAQSTHSIVFNVPVALWGLLGHLFILYILLLAGFQSAAKQRMWPLLFWISLGASLYSLYLAYISTYQIQSYCIMCILGYVVIFAILYYSWFINRRFGDFNLFKGLIKDIRFLKDHWKTVAPVICILAVFSISAPFWFPQYWHLDEPKPVHTLQRGTTGDGHPWLGAENPQLTIVEFTDYMCFQCRKMHYYLRRLVESNPDSIRLVHRHFPMDHQVNPLVREPFHVGAGKLALLAVYAKEMDKFWEANDYFYLLGSRRESIGLADIEKQLDLEQSGMADAFRERRFLQQLQNDIREGLELGITATPAYVIDGKLYEGQIPSAILSEALR